VRAFASRRGADLGTVEMRVMGLAVLLLRLGTCPESAFDSPASFTQHAYQEDFDFLWNEIRSSYAYFDKKTTDWAKVKALYRSQLVKVSTREEFIALLERVLEELYDHHAHLNTNTASSPRLVPSGADIWAAWNTDRAMITQVRHGSNAERAGLKAGMEIISIDGVGVNAAVEARIGRSVSAHELAARDWALRAQLAGRHQRRPRVGVRSSEGRREVIIEDR
jgi:hypothetical protein